MSANHTGPAIRIVPVGQADVGAVAALVNRAFSVYSHLFKGQRTSPTDYRDEAGVDGRVVLVEGQGRLMATAMIAPAEPFTDPDRMGPAGTERPTTAVLDAAHPWLGALYFGLAGVEPSLMKQGFGRLMVSHAEGLARSEGYPALALGTVREFGLVEYYEKFGYEVTHETEHPAGHWDFVVPHRHCEMVKRL